jgi:gluconolactonase
MVDMKVLATGLRFPEGPVALADGSIALVEIARGTVSRVTPDGEVTVIADLGGGPNGLALGPDQALYVCNNGGFEWHEEPGMLRPIGQPANYSGGRIERVDQKTGEARLLYDRCGENKLKGPNDIVFDRRADSTSRISERPVIATATGGASITQRSMDRTSSRFRIHS